MMRWKKWLNKLKTKISNIILIKYMKESMINLKQGKLFSSIEMSLNRTHIKTINWIETFTHDLNQWN